MNEETKNRIVHLFAQRANKMWIAREVGFSARTVGRVLAAARHAAAKPPIAPKSIVDPFVPAMRDLLGRYPRITTVRMLEELRRLGFKGGYTAVRLKMKELRPLPARPPVMRFETAPGVQAQMDYSVYDIDFTAEGRRRVALFGYMLGYSRRQYLRFVEAQDFETTIREHIRAFEHLGGAATVCLYDNMKVIVTRYDGDEPIYNTRFLAFATHYGFRPWACRPRRPRTKGKVERQFLYVEMNLLNGRTFHSLEHLNEVTAWWLANVADVRIHRETKRRPIDLHAEERPHLLPLPEHRYDADPVVYRLVNSEGRIAHRNNFYTVPWRYIGAVVPVRLGERELVIYSPKLEPIARHELLPRDVIGKCQKHPSHDPGDADRQQQLQTLRERFDELGPSARLFLDRLLESHRHGRGQARRILALLGTYRHKDLVRALDRAARFGAYSHAAVERILAVQAKPKSLLETLADEGRQRAGELGAGDRVDPRPTSEYQSLIEGIDDEPTNTQDDNEPSA